MQLRNSREGNERILSPVKFLLWWEQTACRATFPAFPSFPLPLGCAPSQSPQDTRAGGPQGQAGAASNGMKKLLPQTSVLPAEPLFPLFPWHGARGTEQRDSPIPAGSAPVWGDKHLPIISRWPFTGDNPIPQPSAGRLAGI